MPAITLANMLWMKWTFDREFYDHGFMRNHTISQLPRRRPVHRKYRELFALHQPFVHIHGIGVPWVNVNGKDASNDKNLEAR